MSESTIIAESGSLWEGKQLFFCDHLLGQMSKSTIIAESGEGTMHDLRKIAAGEPRGNLVRPPPVSYHIEVRTL